MKILEYGNPNNEKIVLIHGFQSPYQIWDDYIDYYKDKYCVIVPILTGHNLNDNEDFVSFSKCLKEFIEYYIPKYGNKIFAIYAMSMGGVFASFIFKNSNIKIEKMILESSPILGYGKFITIFLTKEYLSITHKAQKRDKKIVSQAINSMITPDKLDDFLKLIDHISDTTITNYIIEMSHFKIGNDGNKDTEIYYLYGGKVSEILFRKVAKYLRKNYKNAKTICFKGKGHCEDALIRPSERIKVLNKILKN